MSTLLLTISRLELPGDLEPLVLSGAVDENPIGVVNFVEPGRQARILRAPKSDLQHGDGPALAASYQQAILGFDVVTDQAMSEAASRLLLDELWAAISQHRFTLTDEIADAPARVWSCDTGSMTPLGTRTYDDLANHYPQWSVSIPCHPIPGA